MSRQERIDRAMVAFYEAPVHEQVIAWYRNKLAQEKNPKGQCVICKSLKLPKGTSGSAAVFEKREDGYLITTCGGRDGKPVCPGYKIKREPYVDQATITSEVHEAMRDTRREIKIIRDRILAMGELTKEDEEEFREMTSEYVKLKQIEEAHKEEIDEVGRGVLEYIVMEDEILVPEAYFGNTEGLVMKTPMILQEKREGTLEMGEYPEMITMNICKEDIPVYLKIDEGTDDE
jgi:hypothetical protein